MKQLGWFLSGVMVWFGVYKLNQRKGVPEQAAIFPIPQERIFAKKEASPKIEVTDQDSLSTEEEAKKKFLELAENVFQRLPTEEDLQKLSSDEVHFTPQKILEAGVELGRIAELLEQSPGLASEALLFYKKCTLENRFPVSIRALCYSHWRDLDPEGPQSYDQTSLSGQIRSLADQLDH